MKQTLLHFDIMEILAQGRYGTALQGYFNTGIFQNRDILTQGHFGCM